MLVSTPALLPLAEWPTSGCAWVCATLGRERGNTHAHAHPRACRATIGGDETQLDRCLRSKRMICSRIWGRFADMTRMDDGSGVAMAGEGAGGLAGCHALRLKIQTSDAESRSTVFCGGICTWLANLRTLDTYVGYVWQRDRQTRQS